MADTVTIPGLGKVKKQTAYVLGGAAVLVVGVAWYRTRNLGAEEAAQSAASAVGGESPINPATGYIYGSDSDLAALGQQSYIGGGAVGYTGGSGGFYTGGGGSGPGFTTNGQWSQAAEDYLVNTVGLESDVVGNALGKYITGLALSPDQVNIVTQAIAFTGYPPTNGPTGYPPSYRTSNEPPDTTPPPAEKPSGPGTPPAVTGLRASGVFRNHVDIDWNPVTAPPGTNVGYAIWANGVRKTSQTFSQEHVWNLKPGTRYTIQVAAIYVDPTGPGSPDVYGPRASITVTTKR